jgi:hypothetical protein
MLNRLLILILLFGSTVKVVESATPQLKNPGWIVRGSGSTSSGGASTLNNNIVAYWKFDETGIVDRAPSVGTITLTNLPVPGVVGPTSGTGKINNGVDFEDVSAVYFENGPDPAAVDFSGTQSFTIAAWAQTESQGQRRTIICKYDAGGNAQWYLQYRNTDDHWIFGISTNGTAETEIDSDNQGAIADATWYFIVGWYNSADNTINMRVGTGSTLQAADTPVGISAAGLFNSTSVLRVGRLTSAGYFDGLIDEIGIWNRVLTSAEIVELFNGGTGKSYPF